MKKRKHSEEQRKMDHAKESSIAAEQEKDSEDSTRTSSDACEEDADFNLPETSNKRNKQLQENRPAVSLNLRSNPAEQNSQPCSRQTPHKLQRTNRSNVCCCQLWWW